MKKFRIAALCVMAATLIMAFGCGKKGETDMNKATIVMESGQEIVVQLDSEQAPISVENFVKLANDKFYDGVVFHRFEEGFVMQGGDLTGTGMGGPGYQIKGEFTANGVETNKISHVRGVISMARSQEYDSAGSQFFITLGDATFLDGAYAAFGTVDEESMKVVDEIVAQYLKDGKAPAMKTVTIG